MPLELLASNISSDTSYGQHRMLNSLSVQTTIAAQAYLPTQICLTAEGILGDQRLAEIGRLETDWDGYGGESFDEQVVGASRQYFALLLEMVPAPEIQPNPNGTVSFEWVTAQGSAQLEIGVSRVSCYIRSDFQPPIFVIQDSSIATIKALRNLIAHTLYSRSQMTLALTASGSRGEWKRQ
jgi:hypothetical protein